MKELYKKLLQKKYHKALRSIPEIQRIGLLEYAQNVNSQALLRINGYIDPEQPYDWPYTVNVKTEYRLKDYLTTSGMIIELLEEKEPETPLREQALLMVYRGETMQADKSKLYQFWVHYRKKINRVGPDDSDLKNKNKVELFEKTIPQLTGEQKTIAEKDLQTLKINIEDQGFRI